MPDSSMRDQASMNIRTELATVTQPARADVTTSSAPEDFFSFGLQTLSAETQDELSRYLLVPANASRKMRPAFGVLTQFWRLLYIICVPLFLLPVAACIGGKAGWCAYVLLWMACYWSAEVVPLAATSLMPVFLFPFFGIMPSSKVATFYLNDIAFVLLCSLVMAGAVEVSNLHKRIALRSLLAIGTSNLREDSRQKKLRTVMLLSVAYAANIGGTGSLIGTGPNLVLKGLMDDMFPESTELTFATWMLYNVPTMLICVLIGWGCLLFSARKEMRSPSSDASAEKVREEIAGRYRDLGPMRQVLIFAEWCVMFLMSSMILLWFTMKPQMFPGWVEMIPYQKFIKPSAPRHAGDVPAVCDSQGPP
ncbi:hypothetical protein MTO96_022749 [Rhipicephalus appendiculatus]